MRKRNKVIEKPLTLENCKFLESEILQKKTPEFKKQYFALMSKAKERIKIIERIELNYPKEYTINLQREYERLIKFTQNESNLIYGKS